MFFSFFLAAATGGARLAGSMAEASCSGAAASSWSFLPFLNGFFHDRRLGLSSGPSSSFSSSSTISKFSCVVLGDDTEVSFRSVSTVRSKSVKASSSVNVSVSRGARSPWSMDGATPHSGAKSSLGSTFSGSPDLQALSIMVRISLRKLAAGGSSSSTMEPPLLPPGVWVVGNASLFEAAVPTVLTFFCDVDVEAFFLISACRSASSYLAFCSLRRLRVRLSVRSEYSVCSSSLTTFLEFLPLGKWILP
mmetsp:Transcript_9888/g.21494  ORF Transcript_9888/g.21494 Transcript_9888/m.21494 type:complete len:249 (+) Transcript_9888:2407-3153(+)